MDRRGGRGACCYCGEGEGAGGGGVASGAFHQCDRYEQVFKIDEKWLGAIVCNKSISYSRANQVVERL